MDLVRRTLEEARGAARSQGKDVGRGRTSARRRAGSPGRRRTLVRTRPGHPRSADARRGDRATWPEPEAGRRGSPRARCSGSGRRSSASRSPSTRRPTALRDGVLSVSAESTAWATQLRMVQAQLLAKIAAAVGDGVVTSLKIIGPVAPSWRKGRYHIAGRGPRDTYG